MGEIYALLVHSCVKGKRVYINYAQPWNPKEQMFATLLFTIGMGCVYDTLQHID